MTGPSQSHGNSEHIQGEIKKNTLGLFSDKQKAEGEAQSAAGKAEHDTAQAKDYAGGVVDSVVGTVKQNVGKLFGSTQTEAEGAAQHTSGEAKKAVNS